MINKLVERTHSHIIILSESLNTYLSIPTKLNKPIKFSYHSKLSRVASNNDILWDQPKCYMNCCGDHH